MPRGHPDYWSQAVASLPIPSLGMIIWRRYASANIAGLGSDFLAGYNVAADEELYIASVIVSCDSPVIQRYYIHVLAEDIGPIYFDVFSYLPFNSTSLIRVPALGAVSVFCVNQDADAHTFGVVMLGFRVTLVPDDSPHTGLGIPVPGSGE